MKLYKTTMAQAIFILFSLVLCPYVSDAQTLAFPEAEGFGRFASGARGNLSAATVYHVTNLNDSGAGSFRDAVSQGNRYIVFDVGGIITLNSAVSVDKSNLYIAGQTAPGGISFYGDKVSFSGANNLISRHFSIRKGEAGVRDDSSGLSRGNTMIFDHMSVTWGVDETFSMNPASGQVINNITIQNSIIGQGLDRLGHSAGGLMTINEGSNFSIIKSVFADNVTRNPKVRGNNEFINNVVYGYETAGYIMGDTDGMISNANAIGNYFIEGPVNGSSPFASGTASFNIYGADNWVDGDRDGVLDGTLINTYPGATVISTPHAYPTVASMTAQQAVAYVLQNAGVNITRDAVDTYILNGVASFGTAGGVILRETDVFPGWGTDPQYLNPRARLADTDNDGMPDNWEVSRGLNATNAADFKNLVGGYTRLDQYLNELGGNGQLLSTSGGAWTSATTWGGTTPTFADTVTVNGGLTHSTGNGFSRQLTLNGSSTVSGGTIDVFDTARVGSGTIGTLSMTGGTLSAGRVMLGGTTPGSNGTLTLNSGATLQTGTVGTDGGTARLVFNGGTFKAIGTPDISVASTINSGGGTIDTNGFSGAVSGTISGTGGLTKNGNGLLVLSGDNNFTGGVLVNGGSLGLGHLRAAGTGTISLNNSTYVASVSNITNTIEVLSSATITAGGLTVGGAITGGSSTTLNINTTASGTSNMSLGGELSGFAGTLNFSGSTGNIRINRSGSSLAAFNLGTSTAVLRTPNGGNVNMGSLTGGSTTGLTGATNSAVLTNYVIGARNASSTYSGIIADGPFAGATTGLTKTGTGTLTLGAANTYTGATVLNQGALLVSSFVNGGTASSVGQSTSAAASLVLNGGTLRYTGGNASSDRLFTLGNNGGTIDASGSGTLNLTSAGNIEFAGNGNRTLTLSGTNTGFNNLNAVLADGPGGTTSLTKTGPGAWRIFAPMTYSGDTNVDGGTLFLVNTNRLPSGAGKGNLNVAAGATVNMYGNNQTFNGLNGAGTVTTTLNTVRTLTIGAGDAGGNFSGTLTQGVGQTLNVEKIGTGTQVLSGNLNYNGSTTVSGGTLAIAGVATIGSGTAALNLSGGNLDLGTSNQVVGSVSITSASSLGHTISNGTLNTSSFTANHATGDAVVSAVIAGSTGISKTGNGTLTLSGTNTYIGGTTVNAGTLVLSSTGAIASGNLTVNNAVARVNDSLTATAVDVGALSLTGTGALNLNMGGAVLNGTTTAAVRSQIIAGRSGGAWTGAGINSSYAAAQTPNTRAVGYRLGGTTFMGVASSASDVLVRTVRIGDTNLDGNVNVVDRTAFSTNFGTTGSGQWFQGDFNYDGNINIVDRTAFAANFGQPLDGGVLSDAILVNGVPNFDYNPVTGEVTVTTDGAVFALILIDSAEANFLSTVSDPDGALGATWNPAVYSGGMNWSTVSFANTAFLTQGTWTLGFMAAGLTAADFATTNGDNVFYADNNGASNVTNINILNVVAVPEPSSVALIGLAGVYFLAGRRRRA